MSKTIVLLNTSIITSEGVYKYKKISLEKAKKIVDNADCVISAIGHISTAQVLSILLSRPVAVNRINFVQKNEIGIVFKLNRRPPEGVILSTEEILKIGFSFGILTRNSNQ